MSFDLRGTFTEWLKLLQCCRWRKAKIPTYWPINGAAILHKLAMVPPWPIFDSTADRPVVWVWVVKLASCKCKVRPPKIAYYGFDHFLDHATMWALVTGYLFFFFFLSRLWTSLMNLQHITFMVNLFSC